MTLTESKGIAMYPTILSQLISYQHSDIQWISIKFHISKNCHNTLLARLTNKEPLLKDLPTTYIHLERTHDDCFLHLHTTQLTTQSIPEVTICFDDQGIYFSISHPLEGHEYFQVYLQTIYIHYEDRVAEEPKPPPSKDCNNSNNSVYALVHNLINRLKATPFAKLCQKLFN